MAQGKGQSAWDIGQRAVSQIFQIGENHLLIQLSLLSALMAAF